MNTKKQDIYFYLSIIFAVWFALTSFAWTYYANLFISFPFGILSLLFWNAGKKSDSNKNRYKYIIVIISIGVIVSLISLALLLFFN